MEDRGTKMSPTNGNGNGNGTSLDIRKLSVNIITVVTIVGFFIWITLSGVKEKENLLRDIRQERSQMFLDLKQEIHELKDDLINDLNEIKRDDNSHHQKLNWLESKLKEMTIILERTLVHHEFLTDNVWTKNDMALWCYEVQRRNKNFECPDYETLKRLGLVGSDERNMHRSGSKLQFKFDKEKQILKDTTDEEKK